MTAELPRSPAVERNRDVILEVLVERFKNRRRILEIGSGTGEHAVHFAAGMPWLFWQTSDRRQNHPGICGWIRETGAANLGEPLEIDVGDSAAIKPEYDAVFSANTAHIMNIDEVKRMFALVAGALMPGGLFCLYGPFRIDGDFTSASNARFDASLRAQDAAMGIRDIEALDIFAADFDLRRESLKPMPANNFLASWVPG